LFKSRPNQAPPMEFKLIDENGHQRLLDMC